MLLTQEKKTWAGVLLFAAARCGGAVVPRTDHRRYRHLAALQDPTPALEMRRTGTTQPFRRARRLSAHPTPNPSISLTRSHYRRGIDGKTRVADNIVGFHLTLRQACPIWVSLFLPSCQTQLLGSRQPTLSQFLSPAIYPSADLLELPDGEARSALAVREIYMA